MAITGHSAPAGTAPVNCSSQSGEEQGLLRWESIRYAVNSRRHARAATAEPVDVRECRWKLRPFTQLGRSNSVDETYLQLQKVQHLLLKVLVIDCGSELDRHKGLVLNCGEDLAELCQGHAGELAESEIVDERETAKTHACVAGRVELEVVQPTSLSSL